MKKIVILSSLALFVLSFSSSAQQFKGKLTTTGNQPIVNGGVDFELKLGPNKVQVPTGTVSFTIDGLERVSTVKFLDLHGRATDLRLTTTSLPAEFKPECGGRQPGDCFATADQSIVFCICIPTGQTGTGRINVEYKRQVRQVRE